MLKCFLFLYCPFSQTNCRYNSLIVRRSVYAPLREEIQRNSMIKGKNQVQVNKTAWPFCYLDNGELLLFFSALFGVILLVDL